MEQRNPHPSLLGKKTNRELLIEQLPLQKKTEKQTTILFIFISKDSTVFFNKSPFEENLPPKPLPQPLFLYYTENLNQMKKKVLFDHYQFTVDYNQSLFSFTIQQGTKTDSFNCRIHKSETNLFYYYLESVDTFNISLYFKNEPKQSIELKMKGKEEGTFFFPLLSSGILYAVHFNVSLDLIIGQTLTLKQEDFVEPTKDIKLCLTVGKQNHYLISAHHTFPAKEPEQRKGTITKKLELFSQQLKQLLKSTEECLEKLNTIEKLDKTLRISNTSFVQLPKENFTDSDFDSHLLYLPYSATRRFCELQFDHRVLLFPTFSRNIDELDKLIEQKTKANGKTLRAFQEISFEFSVLLGRNENENNKTFIYEPIDMNGDKTEMSRASQNYHSAITFLKAIINGLTPKSFLYEALYQIDSNISMNILKTSSFDLVPIFEVIILL